MIPLCFRRSEKGGSVFYIVESEKSFYEATVDLEAVIPRLGFVILGARDLGAILRGKGIDLDDECKVFDVGNYRQMEKMLAADVRLGLVLPWRISVFTENGATRIGLIRPAPMLAALCADARLSRLAREADEKAIQIVDETR
jgi:uncharacterized protein (DUF302 family)